MGKLLEKEILVKIFPNCGEDIISSLRRAVEDGYRLMVVSSDSIGPNNCIWVEFLCQVSVLDMLFEDGYLDPSYLENLGQLKPGSSSLIGYLPDLNIVSNKITNKLKE